MIEKVRKRPLRFAVSAVVLACCSGEGVTLRIMIFIAVAALPLTLGFAQAQAQSTPVIAPQVAQISPWSPPAPVDPAAVPTPGIVFTPTQSDIDDYQKYFIFHRDQTSFDTAYADLAECDGYARGRPTGPEVNYSVINAMQSNLISQYGVVAGGAGGLIGGLIGSAIVEAQMAADRRKLRRGIMRTCMGFKGYSAFGLSKALWTEFNFEEGWNQAAEDRRMNFLRMQAKVASGPRPTVGELR